MAIEYHTLRTALACTAIIASFPFSCSERKSEFDIRGKFRNVYGGVCDASKETGHLPNLNGNSWRFSAISGLDHISWRALVLERMVGLGLHGVDTLPREEIDTRVRNQILSAGNKVFRFDKYQIEGNFESANGREFATLPPFFVLAFSAIPSADYGWTDSQTFTIEDLVSSEAKSAKLGDVTFLLFSDGSVARIETRKL